MVNDRLLEMMITPSASMPTNSRPTPVSSPSRDRRFTKLMPATITRRREQGAHGEVEAPEHREGHAGDHAVGERIPRKLSPRSTTQVPTTEEATTASIPASRARCMNSGSNGSSSQLLHHPTACGANAATMRSAFVRTMPR